MDLRALEALSLPSADGETVRLGDLWTGRSVILVFFRHFG
jgi:hypothetical protein